MVGFGAAAAALPTLRRDLTEAALRDRCAGLLEEIPGVQVLGAREAPHILLASIPGVPVQNTINFCRIWRFAFGRFRLRQGTPEPCAVGR